MQPAPIPPNEQERLESVYQLGLLDTKPEERFDAITREAVEKFKVPISTISILDKDREWYKSCQGLETTQGDRALSFCGHALLAQELFIIEDTKEDARFVDNPAVTGYPFVRFYAGMALYDKKTGLPVGVFCIKDTEPRTFSVGEISQFMDFAARAEAEINKKFLSRAL